jgi:membrane protease YdiL (CAAX protease family)
MAIKSRLLFKYTRYEIKELFDWRRFMPFEKSKFSVKYIILSLIGFIVLWAVVTDAWGYSSYIFPNDTNGWGKYIYAYISRFIWIIPTVLLLWRYGKKLTYDTKALFSRPKINRSLLIVICGSVVYCIIMMFATHKGIWFNSDVSVVAFTIKFAIVAIVEEMSFRGWGYNALSKVVSNKKAVIISSGLFMVLHWPAYLIKLYLTGVFDWGGILGQSVSVIIWGIIFCYLLKRSRTLLNPIIAHFIYNFLYGMIVG